MSRQEESVTTWLAALKAGRTESADKIWNRYVERLVRRARRKLGRGPRRAADEEDVVLSAFDGFLRYVAEGRYHKLDDRDDLWQVLVMLTERRANALRRRELALKRGGGQVRGESVYAAHDGNGSYNPGIEEQAGPEPTPAFAAEVTDLIRHLLAGLPDDVQRRIVLGKLEGCSNQELATRLGISLRSVERKWGIIRDKWRDDQPDE